MKGRKKIPDELKFYGGGTYQPCRMTAPADLKGCACWGGDLSNVSDITAYVLFFHKNDRFQLLPHFWIPEEKMLEKVRKENINYDKWVAAGYVTVTPGNVIDYDLRTSAYDRWNSSQTIIDLQNEGMECNPFGQGYGSMSARPRSSRNWC